MARTLIAGGDVIDGAGRERFRADVLVEGDRIVRVAANIALSEADIVLEADGRVVTPGFVDLHTHYDAQIFWDPQLSSSCHHGVTSVVVGNCGFSLAPFAAQHRSLVLGMLRDLEDMPAVVLDATMPPELPSFAGYLSAVEEAGTMLNLGSFVGHSTLRIAIMGKASYERAATEAELGAMQALLADALAAGAMGFATKGFPSARSSPSQLATTEETRGLLEVQKAHGKGAVMFNPGGAFDLERLYAAQSEIGRPFTWIALMAMPDGAHDGRLAMHRDYWERGAKVHPQVSCRPLITRCTMRLPAALRAHMLTALNAGTDAERLAAYGDPAWRLRAKQELHGPDLQPVAWQRVTLADSVTRPESVGRNLRDLAAEAGVDPFDFILDLAIADRLETTIVLALGNTDADQVDKLLAEEGAVLGLADGGAHPAQICDSVLPTDFLGNWVRGRNVMSLEAGVRKLTSEMADLLGLKDRGRIAEGAYADLNVFDPATIAPGPIRLVHDLPMGQERLLADATQGLHHTLVNGTATRVNEQALATKGSGRVLRPAW